MKPGVGSFSGFLGEGVGLLKGQDVAFICLYESKRNVMYA